MSFKPHFDLELSLKACPPQKFKEATFVKRIVIRRDRVDFPQDEQTRVLSVKQNNVANIRDSLDINGWIYTEQPPFGFVNPNNKDRFIGISGFNRNAAMSQLEWETMIFDVYEFSSPYSKRLAKAKANQHTRPFSPNTKQDLVKQVILAIKMKEISPDEISIREMIDEIAADKPAKEKKSIFETVIKQKGGSDTIKTYHKGKGDFSTYQVALELNLPYEGDNNFSTSKELGYITSMSTPKTILYDAKKLSREYNGAKVSFIAYIDKPCEQPKIYEQRKAYAKKFQEFLLEDAKFVVNLLGKYGVKVDIKDVIENYPVRLKGFLPQVITPDETKQGKPKEETLVDALGNKL
jgi:hypothetical protein